MTFFSNPHDTIAQSESCDYGAERVAPVHIEETPCVVIRAVDLTAVGTKLRWQPQTMQAWLT